jgi:molybdate transport system substrate-binding protein
MGLHRITRVFPIICFFLAGTVAWPGEITVSAASSLSDAFAEVVQSYEAAHPGVKVWLNIGSSGALLQQMQNGAPVDVFASADEDTMTSAMGLRLVHTSTPRAFAGNQLVLITAKDNSAPPATLRDLSAPAVRRIALGNPVTVPAGRYARDALSSQSLWEPLQPKLTFTENVRQAMAYVARGEVDAGLVYATDVRAAGDRVKSITTVPLHRPIRYVIAPVSASKNPRDAVAFTDYVLSPAGQAVLQKFGFRAPE